MTCNEYQLATVKTDIRPQQGEVNIRLVCSVLGLIEELEELSKSHNMTEEDILSEAGDCLYYVASIGLETGITMQELFEREFPKKTKHTCIAKLLKKTIRDYPEMILTDWGMPSIYREPLHDYLAFVCQDILALNVNVEEAMLYNIKKLTDRKARGRINGDGDKR